MMFLAYNVLLIGGSYEIRVLQSLIIVSLSDKCPKV
jgi:hypothetical protein